MTLTSLLLLAAASISLYMVAIWLASLPLRDVSIVDIGWGLGFVMVAWVAYLATQAQGPRSVLLVALPTIWGLRLGGYLAWRNHGKGEDRRYVSMRNKHGDKFWWVSLLTVFGLQGLVMWVVSLPLTVGLHGTHATPGISLVTIVGTLVWAVGMVFEAGGDYQLAQFKANGENQGKVMDRGLWQYTRHPNYFGDFLVWWGLWLVSLPTAGLGWTVISPLVMSVLLMKISGVSLLEQDIEDRRPSYASYKRRTSPFFPRPPAKTKGSGLID